MLFQARYLMLQQKIQRLKIFQDKPSMTSQSLTENSEAQNEKYSLRTVDFLLGTNAKLENIIILGMLTTLKHGRYSIEDTTGSLDLDLTETKFSRGLYTENNFVLAQGWYEDRLFHVAALGTFVFLTFQVLPTLIMFFVLKKKVLATLIIFFVLIRSSLHRIIRDYTLNFRFNQFLWRTSRDYPKSRSKAEGCGRSKRWSNVRIHF